MTKQEAIVEIEKEIAMIEAGIGLLQEEIAENRCTAMGHRQATAAIAYRQSLVEGLRRARAIVMQITEGAEYMPMVEAVR